MKEQISYSEKLRDPRWQKLRLLIFQRDEWTCQSCGCTENNLQVHHLKYLPGIEPWEYEHHYLVTYCDKCHETDHLIGNTISESLYELIRADKIYIKPLAQLTILIENYEPFYPVFKQFLNNCMMEYLKSKTLKAA